MVVSSYMEYILKWIFFVSLCVRTFLVLKGRFVKFLSPIISLFAVILSNVESCHLNRVCNADCVRECTKNVSVHPLFCVRRRHVLGLCLFVPSSHTKKSRDLHTTVFAAIASPRALLLLCITKVDTQSVDTFCPLIPLHRQLLCY